MSPEFSKIEEHIFCVYVIVYSQYTYTSVLISRPVHSRCSLPRREPETPQLSLPSATNLKHSHSFAAATDQNGQPMQNVLRWEQIRTQLYPYVPFSFFIYWTEPRANVRFKNVEDNTIENVVLKMLRQSSFSLSEIYNMQSSTIKQM